MTVKPKPFDSLCVLRSTLNNQLGVSCQKTSGYLTFCKSEYCFDVILGSLIVSIAKETVTFYHKILVWLIQPLLKLSLTNQAYVLQIKAKTYFLL